jgi:hypothetical protein
MIIFESHFMLMSSLADDQWLKIKIALSVRRCNFLLFNDFMINASLKKHLQVYVYA